MTPSVTSLAGEPGFQLYTLAISRADAAWEKLFTITKLNYGVFSAVSLLSGSGFVVQAVRSEMLLALVLSSLVISVSVSASVLAHLYLNYAHLLYGEAKISQKKWLRAKNGTELIPELKLIGESEVSRWSETFPLSTEGLRDISGNIYALINIIPATVAFLFLVGTAAARLL